MNSITVGWRDTPVHLPNEDPLLIAVSAHLGGALRNFAGRGRVDDDSPLVDVPVVVDGNERDFLVSRVVTGGSDSVKHVVLTWAYAVKLAAGDEGYSSKHPDKNTIGMVDTVVVDVAESGFAWQLMPRQRLGTYIDYGENTPEPVMVSTE